MENHEAARDRFNVGLEREMAELQTRGAERIGKARNQAAGVRWTGWRRVGEHAEADAGRETIREGKPSAMPPPIWKPGSG